MIFVKNDGVIKTYCRGVGREIVVNLVDMYTHLGSLYIGNGLMTPEFKARARSMMGALVQSVGPVLRSKWAEPPQKQTMITLLLSARLPPVPQSQQLVLHRAMTKAVRIASGKNNYKGGSWCSEGELYGEGTGYLRVDDILRYRRLLYVRRLLLGAPLLLKAITQSESARKKSYASLIREDFYRIWCRDEALSFLPLPRGAGIERWEAFVGSGSGRWVAAVRRVFGQLRGGSVVLLTKPPFDATVAAPASVLVPIPFSIPLLTC